MAEIRESSSDNADGGQDIALRITEDFSMGDIRTGFYPGNVPVEGGDGWLVHWATSDELAGHIACDGVNGCGVVYSDPPVGGAPHYDPDDPLYLQPGHVNVHVGWPRLGVPADDEARRMIREHAVKVHGALVFGGPVLDEDEP